MPTKPTKYRASQVISAVRGCKGIKKIVCARLGISRPTFDGYLKRWKSVEEAFKAEEADFLDEAQFVIADAVLRKRCVRTSKWVLSTKGAHRGYIKPSPSPPGLPEGENIEEVRWIDNGPVLPIEDEGDPSLKGFLLELKVRPEDLGIDREEK